MLRKAATLLIAAKCCNAFTTYKGPSRPWPLSSSSCEKGECGTVMRGVPNENESNSDSYNNEALQRTKKQLEILKGTMSVSSYSANKETKADEDKEIMYQELVRRPANSLKEELQTLKLPLKGRKPDLARRLVDHYISDIQHEDGKVIAVHTAVTKVNEHKDPIKSFASVDLSNAAAKALTNAGFTTPTSIQSTALPILTENESIIIHSETGSGKTIAYLLPITEKMWKEHESNVETEKCYALILTPTRELAIQVAGVATTLAPPNSVRLITSPSNIVRSSYGEREKSEAKYGGRRDVTTSNSEFGTKLIIGSAKSIMVSLFGDSKMPSSPTSKPEAKLFLKNVQVRKFVSLPTKCNFFASVNQHVKK